MSARCQTASAPRRKVAHVSAPRTAAPPPRRRRRRGGRGDRRRVARTSDDPQILVTAALFAPDGEALLARAAGLAATTRDRQLVAIATAHRRGDRELVDALARDHLVDHPDSVLAAWIAGASHHQTPDKEGA